LIRYIQGVIEAKLTPPQPNPISVLSPAYPGLSYQSPTFYPGHFANISLSQLGYTTGALQYGTAGTPQSSTAVTRNVSEIAIANTPSTVKVYDTRRRCWICQSEQHFASSCPNKIPRVVDGSSIATNDNGPELNNPSEPCKYCKKNGHTVKDCYKLAN